jgi:protein involved in sex pheromone biosynthesis
MSHHQPERETTMKKRLVIAFAICVLFLSACGSHVRTNAPASSSDSHPTALIATASAQNVCHVLQNRQAQLSQQYHAAIVQLVAAQAQGNRQHEGEAEKTLMRLHQSIAQVQAQRKAC